MVSAFGGTQEQEAAGIKGIVKVAANLVLEIAVQINEEIAA
jgi:hypothetical protein